MMKREAWVSFCLLMGHDELVRPHPSPLPEGEGMSRCFLKIQINGLISLSPGV